MVDNLGEAHRGRRPFPPVDGILGIVAVEDDVLVAVFLMYTVGDPEVFVLFHVEG